MISIRASSLEDFTACERRFAARWLIDSDHAMARHLKRPRQHIGAVVGRASHIGVAYLLNELKLTGSHGGALRTRHAKQAAAEKYHEDTTKPVATDDTTKTVTQGLVAAHKIIEAYHDNVRHDCEPDIIEKGLSAEGGGAGTDLERYRITGTMDNYLFDGTLEDLKTGVNRPKPFGQQGAYSQILTANGKRVDRIRIRYAQRVSQNRGVSGIEAINLDVIACERHAIELINRAAGGLQRLVKTGDPASFLANPADRLCSDKFCPAHGTDFCPYGTMV